jgi:hypothetical protein
MSVQPNWNNVVNAGSRRGVASVELWLNGYKWNSKPGAAFGGEGQPDPSAYSLVAPNGVPDGVIDIVVKAYDDLNLEADSSTITVMKGAPCADASACLTGQKCDAGKCYWDPPVGQMGDKCTYPQYCMSGICQGTASEQICTTDCIVGVADSCPAMYDCIQTTGSMGVCFPASSGGGCCEASTGGAAFAHLGTGVLVLGIVLRRRRRPCA